MSNFTTVRSTLQTERHLGWLVYANGKPATECSTLAMVEGWHQANRDEAAALMCEVKPRIIAIGRCENGGAFKVVAPPADWPSDVEIDAIFSRPARQIDEETESERVGAELCEAPYWW